MGEETKKLQSSRDKAVISWLLAINNGIDDDDENNELGRILKAARGEFPSWAQQQQQQTAAVMNGHKEQLVNGNDAKTSMNMLRQQMELLETWAVMIRKLGALITSQIRAQCDNITYLKTADTHLAIKEATNRFLQLSRRCAYDKNLSVHIATIRADLPKSKANQDECAKRLDRWLDLFAAYEILVSDYKEFRKSVESSGRVRLVRGWTHKARHYRCYESTITYEVIETEEQTTTSQETQSSSTSSVSKRFVITGVLDPRTGENISLHEAVGRGVVNQMEGVYVNTVTGERKPIPVAMSEGLMIVEMA